MPPRLARQPGKEYPKPLDLRHLLSITKLGSLTPAIQLQGVAAEHGATHRRRSFVGSNGWLGRCASLAGLQRYVDADRVPDDGVSNVRSFPNDLTAAFAYLSKTLRKVIDGQAK
jgi:hypothetical protein